MGQNKTKTYGSNKQEQKVFEKCLQNYESIWEMANHKFQFRKPGFCTFSTNLDDVT